ncbi:MAG: hypothetical protein ACREAY_10185 [Nitrososphaera sp.]|uniref:hypothetical protein n=1 Tax=Nitrososphaera sp. TaxID=1971748 RepID=UPI003D6FE15D
MAKPVNFGPGTVRAFILNKRADLEQFLKDNGRDLCKSEVDGVIQGIQSDSAGILARRKQIDGFGLIQAEGKFADLIGEAVMTYQLQFYTSTIALCGTMAERICYDFVDFSKIVVNGKELSQEEKTALYDIPFRKLLEFLNELGLIDKDSKGVLHEMYDIRNKYVHFKTSGDGQADALRVLNKFCGVAEGLFSMFKYYDIADGKFVKKKAPGPDS